MFVKALILVSAVVVCAAGQSCPPDASGEYPRCVCDHIDYIFHNDECVRVDRSVCPPPAVKIADKEGCRCPDPKDFFDDYYWFCRTKLYLPTAPPTLRTTTYIPVKYCPPYHSGVYPDCYPIPCGPNQPGKFQPHCTYVTYKPTTYKPIQVCPSGQVGVYPNCQYPCPQYQARRGDGECEPIPCTKGRGWTGDFMPHCKYTPFCPDEFPGHYPYCNRYAINVTSSTPPPYLPPTTPRATTTTTRATTTRATTTRATTTRATTTRATTPITTTPRPTPRTPKPVCEPCECCERVANDVQKILRIFEAVYGKDVIDKIDRSSAPYDLKLKPYVSRITDQLPLFG